MSEPLSIRADFLVESLDHLKLTPDKKEYAKAILRAAVEYAAMRENGFVLAADTTPAPQEVKRHMSEHTELPWSVSADGKAIMGEAGQRFVIYAAAFATCGKEAGDYYACTNAKAESVLHMKPGDAALIVKAVNNHDALVEALAGYERFITMMHEMAGEKGYKSGIALAQERCRKELDRIDAVMSQVKETQDSAPPPPHPDQVD